MKNPLFIFLYFLLIANASAGAAGGPYVAWINLSQNTSIDQMIESRIASGSNCNYPGLVIVSVPEWISKDIVKSAIVEKDKKSLRILKAKLRKHHSSLISDGFDGLISYEETNTRKFSAAALVWPKVISEEVAPRSSEKALWDLFCSLIPPVGRSGL
ncbi:hypothetical protein [Duganella sp. CF458]|uniref:hypothetical protein n=1 Tax=Duganella sp. CF458 TaxID=1884368 RepID=UPI00111468CE|nr:hypothetical protein [Duganella sp. CF458]